MIAVLRYTLSDPAAPVYLMPNLLTLGSLGSAMVFRSERAAEAMLSDLRNNGYENLRVQTVSSRTYRQARRA